MTEKKFRFTHTSLLKLKNTSGKTEEYKDTEQKGFRIRLSPKNKITYRIKTWNRNKKKTEQIVIGYFPETSPSIAREDALDFINNINKGIDIAGQRRQKREEQTLDDIFRIWLEDYSKEKEHRWKQEKSRYDLYIRPHLGKKKLSEISPELLNLWKRKLRRQKKQRGDGFISKSTIQRAVIVLSSIFSNMAKQLPNPCRDIDHYYPKPRQEFLKPGQLTPFYEALNHPDTPTYLKDYLLLSLYTGQRRSNVLAMKWNQIDLDLKIWVIPSEETKNDEPLVVPILDQAHSILARRKETANSKKKPTSAFVFPSPRKSKTGHLVEPKRAWKSLLKRAGLSSTYRLHDIRRTMGSWQAITGSSTRLIGESLGHKSEKSTAHYNHLILDPVRGSMQKAADEMDKYKENNDVIDLKMYSK